LVLRSYLLVLLRRVPITKHRVVSPSRHDQVVQLQRPSVSDQSGPPHARNSSSPDLLLHPEAGWSSYHSRQGSTDSAKSADIVTPSSVGPAPVGGPQTKKQKGRKAPKVLPVPFDTNRYTEFDWTTVPRPDRQAQVRAAADDALREGKFDDRGREIPIQWSGREY
jgi:hypothetical protein